MTIHIVDQSRPMPPSHVDFQPAMRLEENDTLILSAGASIEAYGIESGGISGHFGATLLIHGDVLSQQSTAIENSGSITIGVTGSVRGYYAGIKIGENRPGASSNTVTNLGRIEAEGAGIEINDPNLTLFNAGTISGGDGIYFYGADERSSQLKITNTGLIRSGHEGIAISGLMYGSNIVVNAGHIIGTVILGGRGWIEPQGPATNIYDGRGGTLTGEVFFSSGNDIAYGGDGDETFVLGANTNVVDGGGGNDTVRYLTSGTVDLRITDQQQTSRISWDTIRNIENLNGGIFSDRFIGNSAANALVGNGGHDTLDGYDGNDLLSGGSGNDLLVGGADSDTAVFSGRFSDYTITAGESGTITITDNRNEGDGTDHLGGIEFALFNDRIYTLPVVSAPAPIDPVPPPTAPSAPTPATPSNPTSSAPSEPSVITPAPPAKNLSFRGGRNAEAFEGDSGHDYINGGLGRDMLTGGEGQDTFAFTCKLGAKNVDRIADFTHADDSISLSKAIFSKLQKGMLSKGAFCVGAKARDAGDRIIWNDKTGALSYDKDGSGTKYGAIKFAQLKAGTLLMNDDFFIV